MVLLLLNSRTNWQSVVVLFTSSNSCSLLRSSRMIWEGTFKIWPLQIMSFAQYFARLDLCRSPLRVLSTVFKIR